MRLVEDLLLMDEAGKPAEYSMSAAWIREVLQAKCDA